LVAHTAMRLHPQRKSRQRFHLEIVSDDVGHLREQQEAVICAIQTKVMAGRWRNQILSKASSRLPSRLPKTRSVAKPAISPGTDHDSRDVEVYTGGNRVFRGSRLKALTKLGDYVLKRKLGEGCEWLSVPSTLCALSHLTMPELLCSAQAPHRSLHAPFATVSSFCASSAGNAQSHRRECSSQTL
jgi:hypothetical protein